MKVYIGRWDAFAFILFLDSFELLIIFYPKFLDIFGVSQHIEATNTGVTLILTLTISV